MPRQFVSMLRRINAKTFGALAICAVVIGGSYYVGTTTRPSTPASLGSGKVEGTPARAGFEPGTIDLGDQPWQTNVPFTLHFLNRNADRMVVEDIHSSCGCTVVSNKAQGQVIGPGRSLDIHGEIASGTAIGAKLSRVSLTLASGERFDAQLRLSVVGSWSLSHSVIDFGDVILDKSTARLVREVQFQSEEKNLVGVATDGCPWLQVASSSSPSGATILVELDAKWLNEGEETGSIIVQCTSQLKPAGTVLVKARGVYELMTTPRTLVLGGSRQSGAARIWARDGSGVAGLQVVSDDEGVRYRVDDQNLLEVSLGLRPADTNCFVSFSDSRGRTGRLSLSLVTGD